MKNRLLEEILLLSGRCKAARREHTAPQSIAKDGCCAVLFNLYNDDGNKYKIILKPFNMITSKQRYFSFNSAVSLVTNGCIIT